VAQLHRGTGGRGGVSGLELSSIPLEGDAKDQKDSKDTKEAEDGEGRVSVSPLPFISSSF
jgi:hypothetical protein